MRDVTEVRRRRAGLAALTLAFSIAIALTGSTSAAPSKSAKACEDGPSDRCPLEVTLGPVNDLTRAASNLAPGDRVERLVDLTNTGKVRLSSIVLATSYPGPRTALPAALRMTLERCSNPWAHAPDGSLTCNGQRRVLVTDAALGGTHDLPGMASFEPGATDRLRVSLAVPSDLDNDAQGAATAITYSFTATQRTGR